MAWSIKDEYIDFQQARHVVIFHNPEFGGEHHLIHDLKLPACPHCGTPGEMKPPIDFEEVKTETLAALHGHHKQILEYAEKHPRARKGTGPKR